MTIDASTVLRAAAQAAGAQQYPAGALYVVATPIGNLADLTLRAVHVLALADEVACEDTRTTGALLRHLGLDKPLMAVHRHNEHAGAQRVLDSLARGLRVAFVSDAGTPAVSDPGAVLVAAAAEAGHRVVPVPGASSAAAALSVAGAVQGEGFHFIGFLPARGTAREAALKSALDTGQTLVLFEAPHRIEALALALAEHARGRRLTVCRELTKQFETVATMQAADLGAWLAADDNRTRGEFVVVVHAAPAPAAGSEDMPPEALRTLQLLCEALPLKQAVGLAAQISGAPRNALYAAALARRGEQAQGG